MARCMAVASAGVIVVLQPTVFKALIKLEGMGPTPTPPPPQKKIVDTLSRWEGFYYHLVTTCL